MASGSSLDVDGLLRLRYLAARLRADRSLPRAIAPGAMVHRRRGRGLDVNDIRLWSDGDDLRHMDQHSTARTGVPHTRTYFDEREQSVLLIADFRPSMLFGTRRAFRSVAAAETLILLGWRASSQGGRVGLAAAAAGQIHYARRGRGDQSMVRLTGTLAGAHRAALLDRAPADPPLDAILETAAVFAGTGGRILVATGLDEPGDRFDAVVSGLSQRHDLVFYLIEDAFERAPVPGRFPFTTAHGISGWLRTEPGANNVALEARRASLRKLGANALRIPAVNDPEANLTLLGHADD